MDFLIKEVLYLLDYEDNIKETLFISTDRRTPGYAYEINIKDYNTGYSDLSFRMPCDIVNENGETIKNPKLELLVPLSKVRYNRTIRYMGKESIGVPNADGSTTIYPEANGNRLLENYTMDYIIQPLDKSRQGIGISLTYTAIDFPRFNLSKKKVGLTFDDQTITTQELSLYKNVPLSVPGSIQYLPWNSSLASDFQRTGQVQSAANLSSQAANTGDYYYVVDEKQMYQKQEDGNWTLADDDALSTWSPNAQAQTYPLDEAAIKKLVNETHFSYGILATIYYWPVTESGRFQGVWYEKGGFITLSLYNTYEGSDWEGSDYLESITHEWGHLDPMKHYLSPNNACNYLRYILKNTNWKVAGNKNNFIAKGKDQPWFAQGTAPTNGENGNYYITYKSLEDDRYEIEVYRMEEGKWVNKTGTTFEQIVNTDIEDDDFGTLYDIDIEQVEVARSAEASLGKIEYTDARYALSVSNSNCYNAITSEAKLFNLYPVFNCIDRTVTLKLNVGKDYGLSYRYKSNLKNSSVKVDGEKVITKLYVTGGTDAQGEQKITIGEANRVISGNAPDFVSVAYDSYIPDNLKADMVALEKKIYNHINGAEIVNGIDMSKQKFKLDFPDNLFEIDTDRSTLNLVSFSSGKYITRIYNPTGSDYCYYIYLNDGDKAWKDETKQLYKFDGANITLRRNLEEYAYDNLGTISNINNSSINTSKYIKYCPALPADVKKEGNIYIGNVLDSSLSDGKYVLNDIELDSSFVLSGPDRVYNVPAGSMNSYNYGVGNYYYMSELGKYYYCAGQITESGGVYSKINSISVSGYVFVVLGTSGDLLKIMVNGSNCQVLKDNKALTLGDWLVNDFGLRVVYNGSQLVADETFNPNADEYLVCRSPYGTSYIYNFKYLYDNGWMEEKDILDIYAKNKELNDLNIEFYDRYTKDLVNIQAAYNDAINNYDIYSSKADAQLEALMSQYWVNPNKASDGQFSAFPGLPKDVLTSYFDKEKNKYYMDITYDEPQGDGKTKSITVKRVYFDIFNSTSCLQNYPNCAANKTVARNPYTEGQYHVVANALGWDTYSSGQLTINNEIGGYTEAQDPSKTADSYNKFVQQMKEYYYRAMKADEQMVEAQEALDALMERYEQWEEEVAEIERYLQENYGEYIIEGSYSNDEQPYSNLLIKDGLEASDKYATPDITYTVGVVDSSGLIEYRAPHKLICNQLIKRLHSVGQVAPHVGDYVSIQDEPMGMYGVSGLITQIGRRIDDPYQNTITIDTSYTDADELVGNIITATNTVLSNKDIYGRAAIINNKGELSSTSVTKALSSGTDSINIVSTNGKVSVDDNGLTCVNPLDKDEVMRYNGTGILGSTNGGATWRELLTQDGINANYINAGTINAGKVSITDGGHDITVMNADGLIVKTTPNKPYVLGTLDSSGVTKTFENITVFVGRAANGEGVGYFNGYINATKGGNIAGWSISPTKLSSGSGSKYVGISSDGNYAFWAGNETAGSAPVRINSSGVLTATGATINGVLTANAGSKIGPWNITDTAIYYGNSNFGNSGGLYFGTSGLSIKDKFKVDSNGTATVSGSIHADSLSLASSIKIGEGNLVLTNTEAKIKANTTEINSAKVRITANETAIQSRVTFSALSGNGTTTINGANITTGTISADRIDVNGIFAKDITATGTIDGAHLSGGSMKVGDLTIKTGETTTVDGDTYTTPIKIGGGKDKTIAVYGNPGGNSFNGWHVGLTTHMEFMMNTLDQGWLYLCKGLVVGWGNNK